MRALAKESLFRVPVLKSVFRKMGHIPVFRGAGNAGESLVAAEEVLESGGAVAIYPEGTVPKTSLGELGPFRSGVARLAQKSNAPVVPVGQWGAQEVMPPGNSPLLSVLKASFIRPDYKAVIGEPLKYEDYGSHKDFNDALASSVRALTEEARSAARGRR